MKGKIITFVHSALNDEHKEVKCPHCVKSFLTLGGMVEHGCVVKKEDLCEKEWMFLWDLLPMQEPHFLSPLKHTSMRL